MTPGHRDREFGIFRARRNDTHVVAQRSDRHASLRRKRQQTQFKQKEDEVRKRVKTVFLVVPLGMVFGPAQMGRATLDPQEPLLITAGGD